MSIKKILKIGISIIFLLLLCFIIYYRYIFIIDLKVTNFSHEDSVNLDFKAYFKGNDVANEVIVDKGTFDGKVGKYEVTFTYWDNNKKYSKIKKISIVDTISPKIILIGGEELTIIEGEKYQEFGYTALDNYDGDIKDKVIIEGAVDTKKTGSYKINYSVEDSSGNKTRVTRKVIVISKEVANENIKQ